jgi:predicted dehydrogenase
MITAIGQWSRFRSIIDNVSALALCGEVTVELSASQSVKHSLNSLTLDFEEATINIPQAFSEHSFTRMEIVSSSESTTQQFEAVNPYRKVEDFIILVNGGTSVGTSIEEARRSVRVLEAITESYTSGRAVNMRTDRICASSTL